MNQPLSPLPARDDRTTADRGARSPAARTLSMLRALGPGRLLVLSATALALLAFFAYLLLRAIEPSYTLLYGGLELDDSAQIVSRLEALGVPYRLQGDGDAVIVPADQALRLRMTLAEDGLPRGGTVGDEIFDHTSPLGTTNFLANVNLRRALEGELARTIGALTDVRAARVHLVLPQRELFRRDQIEPSASITLRMLGGRRLDRRQVLAVQHLVAAAVPGLVPERITLVDDRGTLLARGGDGAFESALPSQAEEYRAAYEERLKRAIEQLLERSLGPGRVHAEVSAELDLDQITMTEETFDPEGQVVRSTQTVEEDSRSSERDDSDAVTVGNNLPNAAADTPASGRAASDNTTRSEETVNYEISRRVRNQTQIGGRVRRLSVAVLVDGKMAPNAAGEPVYAPRDASELAEIESLVRSAIGFDGARGDVVEVKNLPFSLPPLIEDEASWLSLTKYDLMRLAELTALALVALMLILLVVRPMLRRLLPPLGLPAAAGALTDQSAMRLPPGSLPPALAAPPHTAGQGDLDGVQLDREARVRADLVKRARDVIEEAPEEAVAIIRSWLHESPG
jgi:flagellar M-ring protein FliF